MFYLSKFLGITQSPQPSSSSEYLKPIIPKAINPLLQMDCEQDRARHLQNFGEEILEKGKSWRVNWRQFSHMHNASIIKDKTFEGGNIVASVKAWTFFLNLWEKGEGNFFSFDLPQSVIARARDALEDLAYFQKFFPGLLDSPIEENKLRNCARNLQQAIKSKISSKGTYLSLGYRHGIPNEGHGIPIRIEQQKQGVVVYLLNLGDGSEPHPIVDYTTSQDKLSFRFFPIFIENKIFWGKTGHAALCHLIRYRTDPPHPDYIPYTGSDVYDIFQTIGTICPNWEKNPERFEAKGQRSGTCAEKAVKNTVHDVFIEENLNGKEVKKIFLNLTLCSLIAGYHTYCENPAPERRILLRNAAEEFGLALQKLKPFLPSEEYLGGAAVVQVIKGKTRAIVERKKKNEVIVKTHIISSGFPQKFPKVGFKELRPITSEQTPSTNAQKLLSDKPLLFDPQHVIETLNDWIARIKDLPADQSAAFLYDFTLTLPIPIWEEKDEWDKVSPKVRTEVVLKLEELLRVGIERGKIPSRFRYNKPPFFTDYFLVIHTLFAIADKLARLNKETKLSGFASPFVPFLFPFEAGGFTSIPTGIENLRYSQIATYFREAKKAAEEKVIFPISPILAVEQFEKEAKYRSSTSQGVNHLLFLRRFIYQYDPRSSNWVLTSIYLDFWKNMETRLPQEITSLYYFSYVAHVLVFGEWNSCFPTKLQFAPGCDELGKQALYIQSEDNKEFYWHPHNRKNEKKLICDDRFKEMGIQSAHFPIFDPHYERMNTNDAVCQRLKEKDAQFYHISESVYRDLLRLTRNNNLKPVLAVQWAHENLVFLDHNEIQKILDHCFFLPGQLHERLEQEPSFIFTLREFVAAGLDYYQLNLFHLDPILFLIRTGICFETFYSGDSEQPLLVYQKTLSELLKLKFLDKDKKEMVYLCLLFLRMQRAHLSIEEKCDLWADLFCFSYSDSGWEANWLKNRKPHFVRQFARKMEDELADPKVRNLVCNKIFHELLPDSHVQGNWEGVFPLYSYGEHTLDFLQTNLTHNSKGDLKQSHFTILGFESLKKIHGEHFWYQNKIWTSRDGKVRINKEEGICEREITFEGKKRWTQIHVFKPEEIDRVNLDFLNYRPQLPYLHHLIKDKQRGEPDIITFHSERNEPLFCIDLKGSHFVITRLNERGERLPIIMVNLSEVAPNLNDPLYMCPLRFAHPSHMICFVNTETREIEELNLFRLDLQFKRKKEGLESIQFPGFYLQENETLEELFHYPGALVLKNQGEEKKVLLPTYKLKPSTSDFSTEVVKTKEFYRFNGMDYHYFEIDPVNGELKNDKSETYLYLALLLKTMGTEEKIIEKAFKYLDKAKEGMEKYNTILEWFTQLPDRSPAALAFNVKLLYHFFDRQNLMFEECFGRKILFEHSSIIRWGKRTYIDYLKSISQEDLSAIPKALRLSQEEEGVLLRTLKYELEARKEEFPTLLKLRYQLLCTGKEHVTAKIAPKTVSLLPVWFNHLLPPSAFRNLGSFTWSLGEYKKVNKWDNLTFLPYPNRMTMEAFEKHFPELYEKARQCASSFPCPFDLTLLSILKIVTVNDSLIQLLFYVRHFPYYFKDLSFQGVEGREEQAAIFNEIVKRIASLEDTSDYSSFKAAFLEMTKVFGYTRETILKIPPHQERFFSTPIEGKRDWEKTPWLHYLEDLFIPIGSESSLPETSPFVDSPVKSGTLEFDLIENFCEGYQALLNRKNTSYTMRPENLEKVKKAILKEKSERHKYLIEKRRDLIKRANTPYKVFQRKLVEEDQLFEEIDDKLARKTHQTVKVLPEMIMKEAVLHGNRSIFKTLLSSSQVQELIDEVILYYHELVLFQLLGKALIQIEKWKKGDPQAEQALAAILGYEFVYDPLLYPEISYFKVTEGKLPRKEQAEIYIWVCKQLEKGKKSLFQHKAGGGKTDYLTPLLMLRAKRMKKMAIFFTTQMIYAVDKHNLGFTLSKLNEDLTYLEVGLHTRLSEENLQFIYEQLMQYYRQGRGMIMTPTTFYAFKLQYHFAGIKEENEQKVKWLSLILDFFKTKCLQLVDEAHQNGDPLTRAIYGVGAFTLLPEKEHQLFLALLKPLLGLDEKRKKLAQLSRLEKNLVGIPSKEAIKEVQQGLAEYMAEYLNIPSEHRRACIRYWIDLKSSQPAYLVECGKKDREKAAQIALAGYFILDLLPEIVKMRTELDHAPSIFPEEEFDTPCHHKTPSTAQYEDPYFGMALTIKGTSHRFLSKAQVRKLLENMIKEDWKEQSTSCNSNSSVNERFMGWVEGSHLQKMKIRDVQLSSLHKMAELTKVLSVHPQVIEYYLSTEILKKMGYSSEQLMCTPAHFINGFADSVLFSATPGSTLLYPSSVSSVHYDPVFEAEVVAEWCKSKNQKIVVTEGPEIFFDERSNQLNEIDVFIDPAGFFCDYPNQVLAKKWLEKAPQLDGIFYFKEGRSLHVDRDEKVCLLLRSDFKKPIELQGSNIKEALEAHQLKWDCLRLGTYYDASHTESANILQKKEIKAFVFIADNLSVSRLVQALMRMRGFLDEKMDQGVIWVYPKVLSQKFSKGGSSLFRWTVRNEVEQMRKRIVLGSFQEIAFSIEEIARQELNKYLDDPKKQIALMKRFKNGLLEHNRHDPYQTFAEHEKQKPIGEILWKYAKQLYNRFNYEIPFEKNTSLQNKLAKIVKAVEGRIKYVTTNWSQKLSTAVEQHTHLKKHIEQIQYRPRPFDPISSEGIYGDFGITKPNYIYLITKKSVKNIFKTKGLTDHFYFEQNQWLTAKNAGTPLNEKYLKPIDFILIVIKKENQHFALVHVNEIVSTTLSELVKGTDDKGVTHKAFLVTSNGKLVQKGRGRLEPNDDEVLHILQSEWMKDLIIDAALLRGQIRHRERLKERIKCWEGFESFWKKVVESLPNPETANHSGMGSLLAEIKRESIKS